MRIAISQKSCIPSLRSRVLMTGGMAALLSVLNAGIAAAQGAGVEQVVVTSTRVTRGGFDAPTPTTVVGADQIQANAEPNVFTTVNQLPTLAGSAAPSTGTTSSSAGTDGRSTLNLRNLGSNRTLVLIDGQRVVGVDTTGGTDVSEFPQGLIQRVDVVTGGASASWGSDAVAGVVNFVLDKNFTGIKGNLQGGITTYGDGEQGSASLSVGTGFANGRGHFEFSGEYMADAGVGQPRPGTRSARPWYQGWKLLQNNAALTSGGAPQFIASPHVADSLMSPGGLITGRGTSLSSSVVGTMFGVNGAPSQFNYGSPNFSPWMIGGDQRSDEGWGADLESKLRRGTLFGRLSFDLTPNLNIWATANWGEVYTANIAFYSTYKPGNLTIQCDNPYMPGSVATACGGAGHSVQFGTMNADLPDILVQNVRTLHRYVIGADGNFDMLGSNWTFNSYLSHSTNDIINNNWDQTLTGRYNAAIDVINDPASGKNICRSAVARAEGCIAYNAIGTGVGDPSAADWFSDTTWMRTHLRQEMASFTLNGAPIRNWAGDISLATGVEYREEAFDQTANPCQSSDCGDPLLSSQGNNYFSGNFHPASGSYHVTEAFVESVVPLLKDSTWGVADLDLAGRATGYSASGYVNTWKAGLNYSPAFLDGVRFRALQSRDIRAPNLNDLHAAPSTPTGGVVDRFPQYGFQGQTVIIHIPTEANPDLQPEKAQTTELGVVYQPSWLPGFNTSVDYYRIGLKGGIGTLSAQQEMDLCFAGNQTTCKFIDRDPSSGVVTYVHQVKFNLSSLVTDGFDVEASYATDLNSLIEGVPGNLSVRSLATHVSKYITQSGVPGDAPRESAGNNSGSIGLWRWMGVEQYSNDDFTFTLTERWLSDGVIDKTYIECTTGCPVATISHPTINNNKMDGYFYLDVGGSYNLTRPDHGLQAAVYFKIDNIANVDPVPSPSFGSLPISNGTNPGLYDTLGRYYHLGIRFSE
jgi:iron complex outermembrane recepter protein